MPHHDDVHSLQIALATALRERDKARELTDHWLSVTKKLRENLNGALLERDALRAENERLRALLGEARDWIAGEGSIVPERLVGRMTAALASGGDRG